MKLREYVVLLLCSLMSLPALAETWYEVEVIVLAQRKADGGGEQWSTAIPDLADLDKALPLPTAQSSSDARLASLPSDQMRLHSEAQRIAADPGYTLLLHTGWRQPGLAREQSFPLRLHAVDNRSKTADDATTEPVVRLDGTLRLILARYLHLDADVRYYQRVNDDETEHLAAYRLKEMRRMRSRELHYLDHPKFGVIALITPYEVPAAAPKK